MHWQELNPILGNLGDFIGSIAVVVTLIYLAVQVRQGRESIERNEKLVLSQVHQARTDTRVNFLVAQASQITPGMESIMENHKNLEKLTGVELTSLINFQRAGIAIQDNVLYQYELGLLDEQTLISTDDVIKRLYQVWERLGIPAPPRVRTRYQTLIREHDR